MALLFNTGKEECGNCTQEASSQLQSLQPSWGWDSNRCKLQGPLCPHQSIHVLIKENLQYFTDNHITALFKHIGYYDLPIDDNFHTVIAPIAVEWVKTFNREQAPTLGSILLALTFRNIPSPELEQLVVKKLDEDNIYRYLDLRETVALFVSLSKLPKYLNSSLFNKLQNVIYQQKAFYAQQPELLKAIR